MAGIYADPLKVFNNNGLLDPMKLLNVDTPAPTPKAAKVKAPKKPAAAPRAAGGSGGGGGGGMSSASKSRAAGNLGTIARYNAQSVKDQYKRADANYDLADKQNRGLAEQQFDQNSTKAASERFAQAKKLQGATRGVMAGAGNAMQGSGLGNMIDMLRGRTDLDSDEAFSKLTQNQNAVRNALDESINTNVIARRDAASAAENTLRGFEADTSAQLNNIDPKYFTKPGRGRSKLGATGYAKTKATPAHKATRAGYVTAPPVAAPTTTTMSGNSYFDKLLNSYNGRG